MKKFALALSVLAAVSCTVQAQGDAEAGKQVASTTCLACHGMDGNSLVNLYPKLAGQHAGYLEKQLKEFKQGAMTGGKQGRNDPIMAGMVMTLTEQQMADVSAFYAEQKVSAGKTIDAATEAAGKKLYMSGDANRGITACVACHGVNGEGMNLAGYPALHGQHPEYLKSQLEKFRSGARANDMNGMMSGVAKPLSDDDIALLSDYISSLK